ncbi:MAG: hypothetical protein A2086_10580 [Spirochaetes bacterium GWD1_27_9]|nr:MAG: hypothetical protein A2Z98_17815 [Spirochaetes bacterium GWB1_27_13]OHD30922.1 MAG: hypothetical protein A2086_10580 [Spirochaetes bacterium GWD1_27_9]
MFQKKIIIALIFSFIFAFLSFGNEVKNEQKEIKFGFVNTNIKGFLNFESNFLSNKNKNDKKDFLKKSRNFKNMGIAGAAIFGIGMGVGLIGVILFSASIVAMGPYATWLFFMLNPSIFISMMPLAATNVAFALFYSGIFLLWVGSFMFCLGLPLMIAGFALSAYYKKKIVAFQEYDYNAQGFNFGYSFKL